MHGRPNQLVRWFWLTAVVVVAIAQLVRWSWSGEVVYNSGLAFGWQLLPAWVMLVSGGFLVIVGWWFYAQTRRLTTASAIMLGLVFGGGASNFVERLVLQGQVVDYLRLGPTTANLADLAIVAGIIGTLWLSGKRS